jgi:cell division protein FtsW
MKKSSALNFDKPLLLAVIGLLVLGVFVIYSGTQYRVALKGLSSYYYVMKQLEYIGLGCVLMGFTTAVDHRIFHKLAHLLFVGCLALLLAVFIYGVAAKGATRWLEIGGFSLQPAEFMKIAIFALMARKLSELGDDIADFKKGFAKPLVTLGITLLLIVLQPNFSMALMIGMTIYILFYVAGVRKRYLFGLGAAFVPVAIAVGVAASYRMKRILAYLHPEENPNDAHQLLNSLVSLGHGGWFGVGVGQGTQKLGFLPESYKDFAFSIVGEELGFVGTALVLILFGIIVYRGVLIARGARSRFSRYFAICITASLGINMWIHVAVCTGIIPTTGQPLPFISYGGTNLVVSMAAIGILLNISRARTGEIYTEPPSAIQDERSFT